MTDPTPQPPPDGDDRRADRALFGEPADGLPPETDDEFARLAAALTAPPADAVAPPPVLVEALKKDADEFFAPAGTVERAREPGKRAWWTARASLGWIAAAVVLLAVGISVLFPGVNVRRPDFLALSPDRALERVSGRADSLRLPLSGSDDDAATAETAGELLWSGEEQGGVMRLTGLAPNDPVESQYQLWIFDADRDERYPVDGGVFDVPASGEAVVPFAPRVPVGRATLFAVTLERPGGVVVSDRSRLPALAKVPGA